MKLLALVIGLVLTVAVGVGPAAAGGSHPGGAWQGRGWHRGPSVFPQPVDPWKQWGRTHRHRGPQTIIVVPRGGTVVVPHGSRGALVPQVSPAPIWVPGQWVWTGFSWAWQPGYWTR